LPTPTGGEDQRAAGVVEEAQRAQFVPRFAVEHGAGVAGEGVDPHARVEFRGAGPQLGRRPIPAFDLIGQLTSAAGPRCQIRTA